MRTSDEIRTLLAEKFVRESARLKSWGTKTDEKSAVSFACAVSEFVRALMAESRGRELYRVKKVLRKWRGETLHRKLKEHVEERIKATKLMSQAIQHMAEESEKKKPFNRKLHKKHKHHRHHRDGHHRRHGRHK